MAGTKPMPYPFRWRKDRLTLLLWVGLVLLAVSVSVLSLTAASRHVRTQPEPAAVGADAGERLPYAIAGPLQRWQAAELAARGRLGAARAPEAGPASTPFDPLRFPSA